MTTTTDYYITTWADLIKMKEKGGLNMKDMVVHVDEIDACIQGEMLSIFHNGKFSGSSSSSSEDENACFVFNNMKMAEQFKAITGVSGSADN